MNKHSNELKMENLKFIKSNRYLSTGIVPRIILLEPFLNWSGPTRSSWIGSRISVWFGRLGLKSHFFVWINLYHICDIEYTNVTDYKMSKHVVKGDISLDNTHLIQLSQLLAT